MMSLRKNLGAKLWLLKSVSEPAKSDLVDNPSIFKGLWRC